MVVLCGGLPLVVLLCFWVTLNTPLITYVALQLYELQVCLGTLGHSARMASQLFILKMFRKTCMLVDTIRIRNMHMHTK